MKVGNKLSLGFLVILILMIAMGTMGYVLLKEVNKSTDKVLLLSHKSKATAKVVFGLREVLIINDFITGGNIKMYDYYKPEVVLIEEEIKRLKGLNLTDQENSIVKKIEETFSILNKKTLEIVKLKDPIQDPIAVKLVEEIDKAALILVNNVEGLSDLIEEHMNMAVSYADKAERVGILVIATISIFAVVIGFIIKTILARIITTPIQRLTFVSNIIAEGDLTQRVEEKSHDEIGGLAASFNKMIDRLSRSRKEIQQKNEELTEVNEKLCSHEEELMVRNDELYETMQELQKANKAIQELNVTLEKRVQERTQELVDTNAELTVEKERAEKALQDLKMAQAQLMQSAKMAAVGQLAGGIAHEINNPLGVILGFSQVIMKRIKEDDPLYKPLKSIERESMRCRKLVINLLTFSRTANQERITTNINNMIEEVLEIVGFQTKVKGIEIINNFDQDIPTISADKNQLQQVVMNLCTNAIDSMNNGRPGRLEIRTCKEGEEGYQGVKIEIKDNGSGISEEVKERIFEPFFTTKTNSQKSNLPTKL